MQILFRYLQSLKYKETVNRGKKEKKENQEKMFSVFKALGFLYVKEFYNYFLPS